MNHQRTSCITLVTTLLVALVSMLTATAASASPFLHDQTHISAITQSTGQAVLPHQPILDRASRQRAPTYDESATGARLADGDNVTGGVAQVLRTPSGARSHAYDLATNNAAAPWSQPSQATAHDSREPIGSSSVDKAAPSVVALSVAAEGGALSDASSAAFDAADNAGDWTVSAKHLAGSAGNWAKFAAGTDPNALAAEALRSPDALFLPNSGGAADSFIVKTDLGQVIGTQGQTWLKVVVSNDGQIITAYPVKG
jgi:hypothetical protein